MICFPNAKINLGLNILSKRPDGYHNLETCFYPIGWCDALEIVESEKLTFSSFGLTIEGNSEDNLCMKAYTLLKQRFDIPPLEIVLQKNIPMGGGLGGGSSDGAFMLKLLNDRFALGLTISELKELASTLGSDCAFFIENQPSIGSGRGNVLQSISLDLSSYHWLVLNPGLHVSTKEAYALVTPREPEQDLMEVLNMDIKEWKHLLKNDFEASVFQKYPELKELKERLYEKGALYAQMSGSGSSLFGLFSEIPDIRWVTDNKMSFWKSF